MGIVVKSKGRSGSKKRQGEKPKDEKEDVENEDGPGVIDARGARVGTEKPYSYGDGTKGLLRLSVFRLCFPLPREGIYEPD